MSEQEQDQFENEEHESEAQEQDEHRDDEQSESEQTESEEFFVGLEGEEANQEEDPHKGEPAPEWLKRERAEIREIRKQERARERRIKELESELSAHRKPQEIELGAKPKLEDFGFDEDNPDYIEAMEIWVDRKIQIKEQEQAKKAEQEKVVQQWQDDLNRYETKKTAIKAKVHDYDEAEEIARDTLDQTQFGILISGADNPDSLLYYLGKYPDKAKELAAIKDPIKFASKIFKLDAQVKVQPRTPKTSPEKKVEGSGSLAGTTDAKLQRLREEAQRTGDHSKVIAYKKSLKK
ncbi:hypothetical protein AYL20_01305 [Acinetobacter venetianus]|uniref:hypothetical protein n=1 Tax=Acinetobacter venetianus TaxID=52133 RepID=UPI000775DB8F|nr:hypothetical protein [Acinetobacter venetianus]KXO82661.1 hypothetical protein AYL20_01305 [Acinetobacter venetianus]